MNIARSVQYVTKTLCLMQPGEILASQLPIMFGKRNRIKAQRVLTEDVQRCLSLIRSPSALRFRHDKDPVNARCLGMWKQLGH